MTPEVRRSYSGEVIISLTESQAAEIGELMRHYLNILTDDQLDEIPRWFDQLAFSLDTGVGQARRAIKAAERQQPFLVEVEVGRNHPGLNEPEEEAS